MANVALLKISIGGIPCAGDQERIRDALRRDVSITPSAVEFRMRTSPVDRRLMVVSGDREVYEKSKAALANLLDNGICSGKQLIHESEVPELAQISETPRTSAVIPLG